MTQRICIFGANGRLGLALTRLAVERGLDVVAFVRSLAAREQLPPGVTDVVGDLRNRDAVADAVAGCDAVFCAFAPRASSPDVFCADATQNIIDAMKAAGVRRLVCITGAMIGDYPHLSWFMRSMKSAYQKQQPALARDRAEQEQRVAASGLDWTLVKPPRLTNGNARGNVRSGEALKVGSFSSICRADLCRFMLDQIASTEYVDKRVVVQH
ncbi:MAG: NAD(P)H-binding protein [Chloroflexi bacterium]|nr:NAD(P)H-binding protein [Chloroflexota bacterium]